MKFTIDVIAQILQGEVRGDGTAEVHTISGIEEAESGSISFLHNKKYESHLGTTRATCVIVSRDQSIPAGTKANLILVDDPYSSFTVLLEEYQRLTSFQRSGIEQPSFIGEDVTVGKNLYLGAFAYIGRGAKIGDNVKIFPNAYIGEQVEVGDNVIIYAGVKIYPNTKIGAYSTLQSGAVIGSDGFGFAPQQDGSYKAIPQLGNVVLEDHVDIGANTVVDCATFGSTVIKKGVKLDNLIQVAHNVEIGEDTVIAAQAGISGSTKVGASCVIGGQAGLVGHIRIGDQTKIQAQSGITKNTKPGSAWYGSPGIEYSNYVKSYAVFKKLPEVMTRIQQLEEKILNLPANKK